jgi:hypothetical protein
VLSPSAPPAFQEGATYCVEGLRGDQRLDHKLVSSAIGSGRRSSGSSIAKTPRVVGRRPPVGAMAYRRPYMSGVTRTLTRSPSVARFRAARFSSGVLAVAGRFSSASRSGLRRSGIPLVCVVATDLMISAEIVPACSDRLQRFCR